MADEEMQHRIFTLLDALAIQVGAMDTKVDGIAGDLKEHRNETSAGFERVERHLGNIDTRVEGLETEVRDLKGEVRGSKENLERRVSALESQSSSSGR